MQIELLEPDQMLRIGEIDRRESVDAIYVCVRSDDGLSLRMEKEVFDPPRQNPGWDEEGVRRRARWWRREIEEGGLFLVAEKEGRIAGFAILGAARGDGGADVVAVFVSREHCSQGLGCKLMESLECHAAKRGVVALTVASNSEVRSVEFYRSLGYQLKCLIDNTIVRFPEAETDITLVKELGS
ncbi:MAG: GNAT family N-acetyltransferase [Candidatus Latescibacteria bacterium]|jgi:ribosomal protein S18 acetylase RimI-like enzyme|nr:GNAT family N-acetyltransferase [Candidatus Latescibacterota bacterium]